MKTLEQKHYNRIKGFLTYDIEDRTEQEQEIILQQTIKVAHEMLQERSKNNDKNNNKEVYQQE